MSIIIYAIAELYDLQSNKTLDFEAINSDSNIELETIQFDNLTAIVSRQDKNDISINKEDVLTYSKIIENIAQNLTILPMRYNSLVASDNEVINILTKNYSSFNDAIKTLYNKDEYSIRFLSSYKNSTDITIKEKNELVPDILKGDSSSKIYLINKYMHHKQEELHTQYQKETQEKIKSEVEKITTQVIFKKPLTEAIIIDLVLLIEKERKNELLQFVSDLQSIYPQHNILLTGPWPPYNFAQIKVE
ncbi:MAG: GvpL/GvpF family gas vesicle protein [Chlorobium sp.]|nr:MAG: hypothetical protein FDX12_03420 [Chlorobium sp.]